MVEEVLQEPEQQQEPTVGCVSTLVSMSMSNVSPGNPINFRHGTSVPTPMLLRHAHDKLCVLLL